MRPRPPHPMTIGYSHLPDLISRRDATRVAKIAALDDAMMFERWLRIVRYTVVSLAVIEPFVLMWTSMTVQDLGVAILFTVVFWLIIRFLCYLAVSDITKAIERRYPLPPIEPER